MFEYIRLMDGILTISNLEAIVKAQELFDAGNYDAHEYPILEMFSNKEFENQELGMHFYQTYYNHVDHCIQQIGVSFDIASEQAVTLKFLSDMLDALASLDTRQNQDLIEQAIEFSSGDGGMAMASVLAEMTTYGKMEIYTKITHVDPDLITILQHMADTPDLQFNPIEEISQIKEDYRQFVKDNDEGPVFEYVKRLQLLPISEEVAMANLEDELEDFLSAEKQARNLYALTIILGIDKNDRKQKAKEIRFNYFPQHTPLIDTYIEEIEE